MRWNHRAGVVIGWLMYWCFPSYSNRVRVRLSDAGLCASEGECRALLKEASRQAGKAASEWGLVWFAPRATIDRLCIECDGWSAVETARLQARGVIFLIPHLGSFPMAVRYLARHLPVTALYRLPRQRWLNPIMMAGSENADLAMAPTNMKGIENLLRALRRGEAIVLPPDQAPNSGGGVWADFFGRPAYTMTLAKKLQRATDAALIAAFAERLPYGQGFRLEFHPVPAENFDEAGLNRVIEEMVRRCPAQFQWSYNRYKIPRGAYKKTFGEKPGSLDASH